MINEQIGRGLISQEPEYTIDMKSAKSQRKARGGSQCKGGKVYKVNTSTKTSVKRKPCRQKVRSVSRPKKQPKKIVRNGSRKHAK